MKRPLSFRIDEATIKRLDDVTDRFRFAGRPAALELLLDVFQLAYSRDKALVAEAMDIRKGKKR